MKYLKTFENLNNQNKYWKIRTDTPYYQISLEKMGMDENRLNHKDYKNSQTLFIKDYNIPYIYVGKTTKYSKTRQWYHNKDYKNTPSNLEDLGMVYQGEMQITQEEIDDWNLKNIISKKYNI